jgi:hypothetical protein
LAETNACEELESCVSFRCHKSLGEDSFIPLPEKQLTHAKNRKLPIFLCLGEDSFILLPQKLVRKKLRIFLLPQRLKEDASVENSSVH